MQEKKRIALTTEELIEIFIDEGVRAYRMNWRGTEYHSRLMMKLPIQWNGETISCFRELAVYMMGDWLHELVPDATVEVWLDGNESTIKVELNDEEQQKIYSQMAIYLKKAGAL